MKTKVNYDIASAFKEASNNKEYYSRVFSDCKTNGPTITIKDVFSTKDYPTQASSKLLENFMPGYDATVVKKIKDANMTIIGKTHLDELGLGGTGTYSAFGSLKNPIDNSREIGGSSSGAAGSIMSNNIVFALGSDTGDSVRHPASFIGKVGFKPSYGAVSRKGMFSFAPSLDTVGWLSHNVSDSILLSNILYGNDDDDLTTREVDKPVIKEMKPTSIGIIGGHGDYEKYISDSMEQLITQLKNDGIKVSQVDIDKNILESIDIVYQIISFSEVASTDSNLNGIAFGNRANGNNYSEIMSNTRTTKFGDMVKKRIALGSIFLSRDNQKLIFEKALKVRRVMKNIYDKLFEKYDILIFPMEIAPKIKDGKRDCWTTSYPSISNLIGTPSISLPFSKYDNMPFNLLMDSKLYDDKKMMSISLYLEKLLGGTNV